MSEGNVLAEVMLELGGDPDVKIWRNNTGTGWTGDKYVRKGNVLIISNPRPLNAGLCVGSTDLIGLQSIVVTPEMIGKRIAVFFAVEAKTETGRVSKEQKNFIQVIQDAGGKAGVARSKEDAKKLKNG